jgi:hypothetical protein
MERRISKRLGGRPSTGRFGGVRAKATSINRRDAKLVSDGRILDGRMGRLPAWDGDGLERLARYGSRPPFSA